MEVEPDDGSWLVPRLGTAFGAVTTHVPQGFASYARVLHPVEPELVPALRWSDIARDNGRTMHALAQWESIENGPGRDRDEAAASVPGPPALGHLTPRALTALVAVLVRHTLDPGRCVFGIWDGWAGSPHAADATGIGTLSLPGRDYDLYVGSLELATTFGQWLTADWFLPQSPNLMWPGGRSWCVATEIDFDSTLIGGSVALIRDILAMDTLEAWPVEPNDSLASDADLVNR